MDEFERYINLSFTDKQNEVLQKILEHFNNKYECIEVAYIDGEFKITGVKVQS